MIARNGLLTLLAVVAIAAIPIAGCGDDDSTTSTTETSEAQEETGTGAATTEGGGGATLTIKMGDFYFAPKNASAQAGPTTIEAPNEGTVEHELVIFKTNMNPAELPTDANGDVDEGKLEQEGAEEVGEIEDVEPGETKAEEFDLTPGKYVMVCNVPGHYAQGMHGTLTVE